MRLHEPGNGYRTTVIALALSLFVSGCATRQDITSIRGPRPSEVCIVQNSDVKKGVLTAIEESLSRRHMKYRVLSGTYKMEHNLWVPSFDRSEVVGCDALLFYVANWNWDMALYMYFASIWMTGADGKDSIARATYDASRNVGFGKFINAKSKIHELMDEIFAGTTPAGPTSN